MYIFVCNYAFKFPKPTRSKLIFAQEIWVATDSGLESQQRELTTGQPWIDRMIVYLCLRTSGCEVSSWLAGPRTHWDFEPELSNNLLIMNTSTALLFYEVRTVLIMKVIQNTVTVTTLVFHTVGCRLGVLHTSSQCLEMRFKNEVTLVSLP